MIIQGNAEFIPENEFRPKIQQALDLLQKKAASEYLFLTIEVEKIRAAEKTGAVVADAFIDIGRVTFDTSLTWLASVLIHECFHITQCKSGKAYAGIKAEIEANIIQLYTLRLIGAPQNEIVYLLAQNGNHFDLDGDGKYTRKDYDLRVY